MKDLKWIFLSTEREAEDHLGLQNPLPRRVVPTGRQEGHFRRHGPDCPG